MKYIVFGGFDYAVRYEMDQDALFQGIDYFVDNNPSLINTTYLGKKIKHPVALLEEDKDDILILIGSIVYLTELTFQLLDMGFEKEKHFIWAINFNGSDKCPRLWKHIEWCNGDGNAENLKAAIAGEYSLSRLKTAIRMVDQSRYDTLVDLGAANERIRPFVSKNIKYIPVDYIRCSNETVLCDINKYEFPAIENLCPEKTCILSIGNIQYCRDWKWYLRKVSETCECFILGHDDFVRVSREYRRTSWTRNSSLFDHEIIIYLLKMGFYLMDAVDFRLRTTIYKFEKNNCYRGEVEK